MDPRHPDTVYAGFQASPGGSIPPSYVVAFVTTNLGKTWRFVPPPHGYSMTDFAGFIQQPSGVQLLYFSTYFFPPKPGQTASFVVATSSNGGRSWIDKQLGCPAGAPCVIFGPQAPQGACGMSEWQQSVLTGVTLYLPGTTRWQSAGGVTSVSQCGSQELIDTVSRREFLVDRSRPNSLLYTRDGLHWTTVSLPRIDGKPVGGQSVPFAGIMTITSTGILVSVDGSPTTSVERLLILRPRSSKWCPANAVLPATTQSNPVVAIQSSTSKLMVSFLSPISGATKTRAKTRTFELSTLRCLH